MTPPVQAPPQGPPPPGPPWTTSPALLGWRWACGPRSGWRPTSAGAERAGWRAHRALLGPGAVTDRRVPR